MEPFVFTYIFRIFTVTTPSPTPTFFPAIPMVGAIGTAVR
jgi:hypothetical protein